MCHSSLLYAPACRLLTLFVCLTLATPAFADTFTVTNTDDAGAGSLRQAIADANTTAGADSIVFNIPINDANFSGQWWTITLASPLPLLVDDGTQVLGFTQTANQGDMNACEVGMGGTVGVDAEPLPKYACPEIAIKASGFDGLTIAPQTSDLLIEGLAIYNAQNGIQALGLTDAALSAGTNRILQNLLVGTMPDGNDPSLERNIANGINLATSAEGLAAVSLTVTQCYVGFNGQVGIDGEAGATIMVITYNEVFRNGLASDVHDGIDVNGSDSEVKFNLSWGNTNRSEVPNAGSGHGIEVGSQAVPGTGNHFIENNTVVNNLGAGIAVRNGSSGTWVSKNIATGNAVGISVNAEVLGTTERNTITKNHTFDNAGLGIDLHAGVSPEPFDGLTLNNNTPGTNLANNLQNYPVITEVTTDGSTLIVNGFAPAGALLEFFIADDDASGFGEGATYLFAFVEGTADDQDTTDGVAYGPMIGSQVVSTEAVVANRFRFAITNLLTSVVDGSGAQLTATAMVSGNTSEFGPRMAIRLVVATEDEALPDGFRLYAAYPNPFNPTTSFQFEVPAPTYATLMVYNATGKKVATLVNGPVDAGLHTVSWEATHLPSGTYFYRLQAGTLSQVQTVTLFK